MSPIPVMTTRRITLLAGLARSTIAWPGWRTPEPEGSGRVRLDVVRRVLDGLDALGVLLGDLELELLLEGEDELDDGERVGLEIVDERGLRPELLGGDLELLADDLLDLGFDGFRHGTFLLSCR